ncbi:MAG: TolC family protein [Gallionellaceae bacterium]|jgi:outer membrane protein
MQQQKLSLPLGYSTIFTWLVFALLLSPVTALASDPFNTEADIVRGNLDIAGDSFHCNKEKINSPLSLADVVDLALCNNPQTAALWSAARSQAAQIGVSTAAYLPTLSAQGSVAQNFPVIANQTQDSYTSKNASLAANYLLYDFGGRSATLENAKQLLIAVNATRDASLQSNYLTAVQAYYALLSARASVSSYVAAEASARESLAAAQARYQAGVATPVDKLQAQTTLSQATFNRINAQGAERNAQGTLANIMGFDATQNYVVLPVTEVTPDPAIEQDIGKLIADARHNRPDLTAAESQIKVAEAQLDSTRATGRPVISVGAMTGLTDATNSADSRNSSIGITLSVPLFSGFATNYQIRAAQAQLQGKIAARDSLANQIALDVWKAYQGLLSNSQALRSADDLVSAAEQSEKMILGRYKAGVGNILDTLTAQSTLANAHQQRVSALYNFLFSRFALAQAIGQLDLTQLENRN